MAARTPEPVLLLLLVLWAASVSFPADAAVRNLVVVGGNLADDNDAIYGAFIDLAGGPGAAVVGVVTAASSEPTQSWIFYRDQFLSYGAKEVHWFPVTVDNPEAAFDPAEVEAALDMTGIFFGGGDQSRITESLFVYGDAARVETPLMFAIREGYESGRAVVGGTSAGADAITGAVMVHSGQSYDALVSGAIPGKAAVDADQRLYYDPEGGMGLLPAITIDTHFSQRGRQGRTIRLLWDTREESKGATRGFGVDEDTALIVATDTDGDSVTGEVLGTAGVFFADVGGAADYEDEFGNWGIDNVMTHYLTEGDAIDLSSWGVTSFSEYKSDVAGREQHDDASVSAAIFAGETPEDPDAPVGEFARIAVYLTDSTAAATHGDTFRSDPAAFRVDMSEDSLTRGASGYREGAEGDETQYRVSYEGIRVDIGPYLE